MSKIKALEKVQMSKTSQEEILGTGRRLTGPRLGPPPARSRAKSPRKRDAARFKSKLVGWGPQAAKHVPFWVNGIETHFLRKIETNIGKIFVWWKIEKERVNSKRVRTCENYLLFFGFFPNYFDLSG